MWLFSYNIQEIVKFSIGYLILVTINVLVSLLFWGNYEWSLRSCLVEFKKFSLKMQRNMAWVIGAIFLLPTIIFWLFMPKGINSVGYYLVISHLVTMIIYIIIMDVICTKVTRRNEIIAHLRELNIKNLDNVKNIKEQLSAWYNKDYAYKDIVKAFYKMQKDEK